MWPPKNSNRSLDGPRPIPLKLQEQLALCATFPERVLFIDIETTGLSHYYDEITIVGWSFGGRASTFVKGQDLSLLLEDAANAKILVTFNGIRFDQRFLRQEFPEIALPEAHIDLMYLCRRVGLTGGQKAIENELGLLFREDIVGVDGFAAVLLWHRYLRGDLGALKSLIHYNRADIAAMGAILDDVLSRFIINPDLFATPIEFLHWSAPPGWRELPEDLKPASEDLTKALRFVDIFEATPAKDARIVGIDLTGSEKRATGWCLLDGSYATTTLLTSDQEILESTIGAKPDLVSIDSPLCLPSGRITVEDSDPGREQYGIMRQCERELKKRGINVYPSLLPSMQKLTARGIFLAQQLREKGIPVIESYPGAAQDIMRIPRKGAGVEWLRLGLSDFGITGDYQNENVSHDELDAITSALVGTFHMAGLSEALGTEEEPPLIIPKLDKEQGPYVIGISGPIAAGKTTFAQALADKGFAYTRFSLVIDDMLSKQGLELDRINRQKLGGEINADGRQRWLAEQTIRKVEGASHIVVDGLRFPEDHAYLVEKFGARFHHIYIEADEAIRRNRYNQRGKEGGFDAASGSDVEKRVIELASISHEKFVNNASKSDIVNHVTDLIHDIKR